MRIVLCSALIIHMTASGAQSQTFDDLQIQLGAYTVSNDGGEKPLGVWLSTGPVVIGQRTSSTFSFGDSCEAFTVSSRKSEVREDATTAWHIELTPVRVVPNAVTFRLRWIRFASLRQQLDQIPLDGKAFQIPHEEVEIEVTLRPGESLPVDSVRVPAGAKTADGRPCGRTSLIRASVDNYPWQEDERRLVVADLWLLERLPNGTESQRSQPFSVRGLPSRPLQFYFDTILDADIPLDIYGTLAARLDGDALAVAVEARCRWGRASGSSFTGPQRSVTSDIHVKPAEVVDIRLPLLGSDAGAFAKRQFSIRIRARQLR